MSRCVRMVPANWQHPKYPDDHYNERWRGAYIPLLDGRYADAARDWDEAWGQWQKGKKKSYGEGAEWIDIPAEYAGMRYSDYDGARPSPDDYMPDWPADQRTHLMMYETTSEGTPLSPAFSTPEELARWLADNGASAFAGETATYSQWLATCKSGWAPSAIFTPGDGLTSGVAALASITP